MVLRAVAVEGYGVVYVSASRERVVFASLPPDSTMCPACKDVLRKPRRAPCGHALCATCARESIAQSGTCAVCRRAATEEDYVADEALMLEISNLRAHCPYAWRRDDASADGSATLDHRGFGDRCCGAIVRFADLARHAEECDFKIVICGLAERDAGRRLTGTCAAECARRALEGHREECAYAARGCANAGCDWVGSAMYARDHADVCEHKPVACRHGCRATMTNADAVARHEEICPVKEVLCGVVDEADADEHTRCCPAMMKRNALARHRQEMCEYARPVACSDCQTLVSERSALRHKQVCVKIRRACTAGCGALVSAADMKQHLELTCPSVELLCEFHEVGCVFRCSRDDMARHYETSTAAHVKLLLRASAEIREVSETMAKDVEKVVRDEEGLNESDRVERDAVLRALRAEEERMLQDMKTLRENEADARKRGELYAQALEKALEDQAETYDAAIAEVREEILAVRGEFETYKSQASFELNELRQAMSSAQIALSEVSARAATITRDGGILDEHKLAIEEEIKHDREHALGELEKATRQIRFEIEDASAEHARKILSLRDDIRMVLNSRIR